MSHGGRQKEKFGKFLIFLTAVYCPILMIVITLILFWKEDVYDFCTIYLTVRISYRFQ